MASSGDAYARSLVGAMGDLTARLGLRNDAGQVVEEVMALAAGPLANYRDHPHWPSALCESGVPFELSVKLGGGRAPSVRCVVDTSDHRHDVEGNWRGYLRDAALVAGCGDEDSEARLWQLCRAHLDGVPPGFGARMMHGLGYGDGGRRRGTLYFRMRWLPPVQLARRFPPVAPLVSGAESVEVVGYDFVAGRLTRAKAYAWLDARGDGQLADLAAAHPELLPAAELVAACPPASRPSPETPAVLRQVALEDAGELHRLFFFCSAWGWGGGAGLGRLLDSLNRRFDLDLSPLLSLSEILAHNEVRANLGMVAIGGDATTPTVTFYFWPVGAPQVARGGRRRARPPAPSRNLVDRIGAVIASGVDYLAQARRADGSWSDYDIDYDIDGEGASNALVTAVVASLLLSGRPPPEGCPLGPTADWLAAAWGSVAGDRETAALAIDVLSQVGRPLPPGAATAVLECADAAELTGAALAAGLRLGPDVFHQAQAAVRSLVAQQGEDGGWRSTWWTDDLVATARAVRALRAAARSSIEDADGEVATQAVRRARDHLSAKAVADDPFALGAWLYAWHGAGGPAWHPAIGRMLAALEVSQQRDGRWLGGPYRRARPTGPAYTDGECLVTTATAVAGLRALMAALHAEG